MKKYTNYKITNLIDGKVYIGYHYGEDNDGYLCSSYNEHFWNAIRKYEPNCSSLSDDDIKLFYADNGFINFYKETIQYYDDERSMKEGEKYWIEFYRNLLGPENVYNLTPGGDGGWDYVNDILTSDDRKLMVDKAVRTKRDNGYYDSDEFKSIMELGRSGESAKKAAATRRKNGLYDHEKTSERSKKGVQTKRDNNYYESDTFLNGIRKGVDTKRSNGYYESEDFLRARKKSSIKRLIKYKYIDPNGGIHFMDRSNAARCHPDWIKLGPADQLDNN